MEIKNILDAQRRVEKVIHRFPVEESSTFSKMSGATVYLKTENRQKTGAFKVRGAYNKIASLIESGDKPGSVIACSAGNHAQGVAYSAQMEGIPATIVMPRSTPIAKVDATRGYGANVVLYGDSYDDTEEKAKEIREEMGAVFIHPFDDEDVIAGQGTIGLEIMEDVPDVDIIFVPAGGGGLLAGVAIAAKSRNPDVKIIGVQAQDIDPICKTFHDKDNKRFTVEGRRTLAEGIAVKVPGKTSVPLVCKYADDMITVTDDEMAEAVLLLLERTKNLVEPSGAASVAALLSGKVDVKGKKVVCILSGGNVDVSMVHQIIEKGLVKRGRRINVKVVIEDKPGELIKIIGIISGLGANIVSVNHDRVDTELRISEARVDVACDVSSKEQAAEINTALKEAGFNLKS